MDKRNQLKDLVAERDALKATDWSAHPLNTGYLEALTAAFKEMAPRRKAKNDVAWLRGELGSQGDAIFEEWAAKARLAREEVDSRLKALKEEITELCEDLEPQPGGTDVILSTHWPHHTQTAAEKYGMAEAEIRVQVAEEHGLTAWVETVTHREHYKHFTVHAKVADPVADSVIMDHKHLTVKDWLKATWGRGVNPRVFNPFLPHGLEEQLGVDYFGKDVTP